MKTSRIFLFIIFVMLGSLLAACAGGGTAASSWPGVTADAERGSVYVSNNTHVYAVNLANGAEKWRFPVEADNKITFFASPELSEDGQLIVGGYDHVLYSLQPDNGQQNWMFDQAKNRYVAPPLAAAGKIFAPNSDETLYALEMQGSLSWTHENGFALWGKPISDGENVYLPSMGHYIHALAVDTGGLVWKTEDLGGSVAGSITLSETGVLYIGTFGSEVVAIDAQTGNVLWRVPATNWVWNGPTLDGDTIYFGDLGGALFAVDAESGSIRWQTQPDTSDNPAISDSPLVVGDTLFIVTESGNLYAIDKANGNPLWTRTIPGKLYSSPVMAGETLVVAAVGNDALLVAFDLNGNQRWSYLPEK